MGRQESTLVCAIPLGALFGVALFLDYFGALSNSTLFLGVVSMLGLMAAALVWASSGQAVSLLPLVPFLAAIILLRLVDTTPLKPFGRFYAAIVPGMTETEVLSELDEQFPPKGRYVRPFVNRLVGPDHLGFILDRSDGRYDTEIVALDFIKGRVHSKRYIHD